MVVQVPADLDARLTSFLQQMVITQERLVLLQRLLFQLYAEVVELLRPLVGELDDEEDDAAQNCDRHVKAIARELPHLQRRPSQHNRDR